ncbi:MAG: hypothetical protein RL264_2192 [Bacteroidota bacterium]|jgi:hypothetical protein
MKKSLFVLGLATIVLSSCGGEDNSQYEKAAEKICSCMTKANEKREAEKAADTLGFNLDLTDLDYALCALDVATEVDPFDDKMAEAIKTKCPDLSETHKKYVAAGKKK